MKKYNIVIAHDKYSKDEERFFIGANRNGNTHNLPSLNIEEIEDLKSILNLL